MLMTKERELKEAVREGRDRVRRFEFSFSCLWIWIRTKNLDFC